MKECKTKDELKEHLVSVLPEDVQVWVKERKLKTSTEAAELADNYAQARKQNPKTTMGQGSHKLRNPNHQYHIVRSGKDGSSDCHRNIDRVHV